MTRISDVSMSVVRKLFLGQVEVGRVDAGIREALAENARLGGRRGCEAPARAEGSLILDGRDIAYAVDVAQVETSGDVASRRLARLGESNRSHTAKRQQHEKREGDDALGNSPHARPHSLKQTNRKDALSSYYIHAIPFGRHARIHTLANGVFPYGLLDIAPGVNFLTMPTERHDAVTAGAREE